MKLPLALAAILSVSVPLYGQQNAHAVPIPTTYPDAHAEPIPNVKEPPTPALQTDTSQLGQLVGTHVCVIVEDSGKNYNYVEGNLPRGTKPPKRFSDRDIHRIITDGGWIEILRHGYSDKDLAKAQGDCFEGSTEMVLPLPAQKP